jgi:phosphatidylglycerophosphate synthase
MYILSHMTKPEPSLMGKATIVMQVLLIAYTLLSINVNYIPPPTDLMFWTVAVLTIVSGLQYIYRGLQITNEK